MDFKQSSFGASFLDSSIPRTPVKNINSDSNSINSPNEAIESFTPVSVNQVTSNPKTPLLRSIYQSKIQNYQTGEGLTPILPNKSTLLDFSEEEISPSKLNFDLGSTKQNSKKIDSNVPQSILKKHPQLSSAIDQDGKFNPIKGAKVLFSPKKTVIDALPYDQSFLPNRKSYRHRGSDANKSPSMKYKIRSPYTHEENLSSEAASEDEKINEKTKENTDSNTSINKNNKEKRSWFTRVITDPSVPYVLSLYLQLIFNIVLISFMLYFIFKFISTIKADVSNKVENHASDVLQEISMCSREYMRNNCTPGKRVPALEKSCLYWEKCMNRDPTLIGKSKITAETFAEIVNGFIKPISWKSIIFLSLITFGSLALTNMAFGSYRNSSHQSDFEYQFHQQSFIAQSQQQQQTQSQHPKPVHQLQMGNTSYMGTPFVNLPPPQPLQVQAQQQGDASFLRTSSGDLFGSYSPLKYQSPGHENGSPMRYGSPSIGAKYRHRRKDSS